MSLLFNMLSRLAIAFLPRSKHLLISWLQLPSAVILEPKKIKSVTAPVLSLSIRHEVMGPDAMILVFWMLSFKTVQSLEFSWPENWSGYPFLSSEVLPNPGIKLRSPVLQVDSLPAELAVYQIFPYLFLLFLVQFSHKNQALCCCFIFFFPTFCFEVMMES